MSKKQDEKNENAVTEICSMVLTELSKRDIKPSDSIGVIGAMFERLVFSMAITLKLNPIAALAAAAMSILDTVNDMHDTAMAWKESDEVLKEAIKIISNHKTRVTTRRLNKCLC